MGVEEIIIIIDGRDTVKAARSTRVCHSALGYAAGACIGHATF
jgi:hypothetical protein